MILKYHCWCIYKDRWSQGCIYYRLWTLVGKVDFYICCQFNSERIFKTMQFHFTLIQSGRAQCFFLVFFCNPPTRKLVIVTSSLTKGLLGFMTSVFLFLHVPPYGGRLFSQNNKNFLFWIPASDSSVHTTSLSITLENRIQAIHQQIWTESVSHDNRPTETKPAYSALATDAVTSNWDKAEKF